MVEAERMRFLCSRVHLHQDRAAERRAQQTGKFSCSCHFASSLLGISSS
jgi:hypothetical protein